MAEANPDPSGSTGEFRAFVENGKGDQDRRGIRPAAVITALALAVLLVAIVVVLAMR